MAASVIITVTQDGTGDYVTVQEAIDAVPLGNNRRTVIRVAPGIYKQPVYVPKTKNFITLAGLRPEDTVLTWHNTATQIDHHQGARLIGTGTFGCGSIIVEGEEFIAENITFENSAPQVIFNFLSMFSISKFSNLLAFLVSCYLVWMVTLKSISITLYPEIKVLSFMILMQDTLYLHYGKQYLRDCYIEGSVDFIFGNSTALLEHCHIHCKSAGYVTAQSRKSSQETTGYVFLRCVITGVGGTSYAYLGRPWGPFGRVVYAYTYMDACIKHVGWDNWGKTENERSACFYEYRCYGPGSCPSKRVTWARELIDEEAEQFLMHRFIDPDSQRPWLAQRMAVRIPYSA
ncbi:pectinesterase 31-like [Quercus suber]|uniref:pectinesterase 31-like n=1 Tax=Quercus suber TaxID=58331 RepID=UPI0032DFEAEB